MEITRLDKSVLRTFSKSVEPLLKMEAEKLGLSLRYTGGKYNDLYATIKFEIAVKDSAGVAQTAETAAFARSGLLHMFGLTKDDLGREFSFRGERYKVTGLAPRSYKFPVLAARIRDNKIYKFPPEAIKRGSP